MASPHPRRSILGHGLVRRRWPGEGGVTATGACRDCPTFDTVMAQNITAFYGNITAYNVRHEILPSVNTGNLHVMIADYSTRELYVSTAMSSTQTGNMNAYSRQYLRFPFALLGL